MRIIQGSIQCRGNRTEAVHTAACTLAKAMLEKNACHAEDIEQILFAVTDDMEDIPTDAIMQELNLEKIPSFTVQQFRYQTDMDMCLQMMIHLKEDNPNIHDVILGCPITTKGGTE